MNETRLIFKTLRTTLGNKSQFVLSFENTGKEHQSSHGINSKIALLEKIMICTTEFFTLL